MARGWESKAVEDQVNERAARREQQADALKQTDAERVKQTELRSLQLSRARIVSQLEAARNPSYRTMLERALTTLDEKIAQVGG